jgi:antitoxin (DNA-binding transcriptional repressor) of toxin-antitoxin stability system
MNSTITKGMETFTVEDFQKHFDELLERVENGESFVIKSEYGNAVIVPCAEYQDLIDDEFNFFSDHNDGC